MTEYESRLESELLFLDKAGIYEFTRPDDLRPTTFSDITNDLVNAYNHDALEKLRHRFNNPKEPNFYIYLSKCGDEVISFLKDEHLVHFKRGTMIVEKSLGLHYMSLLANYATLDKPGYSVGTDSEKYKSILFEVQPNTNKLNNTETCINMILNKIPQPSATTSFEDIINFRNTYRKELLDYRILLSDYILKLKSTNMDSVQVNKINDEFERYNIELEQMMKAARFPMNWGVLEVLAPPLSRMIADSLAGGSSGALATILESPLIPTGISLTLTKIKRKFGFNSAPSKEISYLYHAAKENIL